jgi:hypothetical protein
VPVFVSHQFTSNADKHTGKHQCQLGGMAKNRVQIPFYIHWPSNGYGSILGEFVRGYVDDMEVGRKNICTALPLA